MVGLTQNVFPTTESSGQVEVCAAILSGTTRRNIEVVHFLRPGTASAGMDYIDTLDQTFTFTETESQSCISIELLDNILFDLDKTFTVNLDCSSSGGIVQCAQETSTASVVIANDDCKLS